MKQIKIFSVALSIALLFLSSCCTNVDSPAVPTPNQPLDTYSETPYSQGETIPELPFYEKLALSASEQVSILDVSESRLLLNVYSDYAEDEPQFKEEGYNSTTKRLEIYDMCEERIALSLNLKNGVFCTDASLVGDSFTYVAVSPAWGEPAKYSIEIYDGATSFTIASGESFETGFDEPQVEALGDTCFAYSFYNQNTRAFGVNIASLEGKITPQVSLVDDGATEHLRTTLCSNGKEYIYYAAVNSTGTIFVGDAKCIVSQFSLPKAERVYEFCFLENSILFTMEKTNTESAKKEIIIKDLNGKNILEQESNVIYRLKSDGKNMVLGVDGKYQTYSVNFLGQDIIVQKIDLQAAPVLFYSTGEESFLLHFYRSMNGSELSLLQLGDKGAVHPS